MIRCELLPRCVLVPSIANSLLHLFRLALNYPMVLFVTKFAVAFAFGLLILCLL